MEEKREVGRIKKMLVIQYSILTGKYPLKWDISGIRDIGAKGVCVTARSNLKIGTELLLVLKIPSMPFKQLTLKGQVVSADELKTKREWIVADTNVARIKFTEVQEEDRKLIDDYVDWFWETYIKEMEKNK